MKTIITSGMKKFIEANAIGFSSVNKNGTPHNIAVAYCKVVANKIVVSNSHIKKTIENIKNNPNVSLVLWNKGWEKTCVGFEILGIAKNYDRGKWLDYVQKLPDNKGYDIKSAIVIEVKKIKPLAV